MIGETIWEMILTMLIGAFCGLVAGQFVENRENLLMTILIGMCITLFVLVIYYGYLAFKEYKREKRKEKLNRRGAYIR